ncbi:hypothetical protein CDD82_1374 [Ophiocordyceps australis]|uniref:Uncharacterized protein n=1 Tax=Ophiocordyceps australis TaxID=1399860 RepID=A0A2C5YJR3_9HYPO|nr:hypothetical protein CDD82_1374 [Ophiocordyceps australis]
MKFFTVALTALASFAAAENLQLAATLASQAGVELSKVGPMAQQMLSQLNDPNGADAVQAETAVIQQKLNDLRAEVPNLPAFAKVIAERKKAAAQQGN